MTNRKIAYILVGISGTGKSTWRNHLVKFHTNYPFVILSTDDIIDHLAKKKGKTYTDIFMDEIGEATVTVARQSKRAFDHGLPVIWDNTNLTTKGRKKKLDTIPKDYKITAVVFREPSGTQLQDRLNSRAIKEGKIIPKVVLERQRNSFNEPTLEEGFDEIIEGNPKFRGSSS